MLSSKSRCKVTKLQLIWILLIILLYEVKFGTNDISPWPEVQRFKKKTIVCHLLQEHSLLYHAWLGQIWKKNRHVNVYFVYDRDFTVFFITVCARDHCCHCVLCYLTHRCRSVSFVYASCWGQQSCAHWQSYLSHSLNTLDRLWGRAPIQNMCLRTAIFTHKNQRQGHAFWHGHPNGQPFGGLIALYAKH